MHEDVTEDTIRELVESFYSEIRQHPQLGPIFGAHIADQEWSDHLDRMVLFWHSVMLASGRYKGSPMQKHMKITEATPDDFAAWLALFETVSGRLFVPDVAAVFLKKANMIAQSLQYGLFFDADEKTQAF